MSGGPWPEPRWAVASEVMRAKVLELISCPLAVGLLNDTWSKVFCDSNRSSKYFCSVRWMSLRIARFVTLIPGPWNESRPTLPKLPYCREHVGSGCLLLRGMQKLAGAK